MLSRRIIFEYRHRADGQAEPFRCFCATRIAPAGIFGKRADFDVFPFAVPVFQAAWFFGILIGTVWLGLGIANLYVLSYRVSPLSAIDFAILQLDWSFIGIYMSVPAFILLVIAVILLLAGL